MRLFLSLCGFAALSLRAAMAEDAPCTAHDGDNYYDLTSLSASKDYQFESPSGVKFVINVCKPIVSETWALKVDRPEDVGGVSQHERGSFSLGYANTSLAVINGYPVSIMTGGSECTGAQGVYASSAIRFVCDTSVFGSGKPELVAQLPSSDNDACAFFVDWRTHVACPTHEKTGAVGFVTVFLAVLGTLLMLYILVGTFYNRYVLELRGFDQIPRISFAGIAEFARSCVDRLKPSSWHTGGGGWTRRTRGAYRGLTGEEGGLMAGPPGFLDEQDEEESHAAAAGEHSTRPAEMDSDGVIRL
ncbi:mannose 6-phosphate receptor domain-containing protein [Daedalea quercina L-15889]|uniref:Autophagy-related protein 27 n=1 Tax=Daedalea quercina L-15889 TaxID=1314783 RepID=A0A165T4G2_9APHY|nr:mannose 6-phosphate receptor domain-containing protein [Daedalea quercina L-15889]